MTITERLERIQKIFDLADLYDQTRTASLALNGHAVHPVKADFSSARGGYVPPKGRWIATIGRYSADHDDPEQAVSLLERQIVLAAGEYQRRTVEERRESLRKAEELARQVEAALQSTEEP